MKKNDNFVKVDDLVKHQNVQIFVWRCITDGEASEKEREQIFQDFLTRFWNVINLCQISDFFFLLLISLVCITNQKHVTITDICEVPKGICGPTGYRVLKMIVDLVTVKLSGLHIYGDVYTMNSLLHTDEAEKRRVIINNHTPFSSSLFFFF